MLKIVTTILCVYMLVRCVLPLRCKRPLKMLLALLVLLVGFRLHIFSLLYATFNPELPRWILVSTGVPHVLFFLLALLSLLRDGVCLIWWLARRLRPGLPALPGSNRQMAALLEPLKGWRQVGESVTVRSAAHAPQLAAIEGLAAALIADISGEKQ